MAAIASVSFTTVSSATLAAGTFAFFAGQAGAEDLTHDPILTQQQDHAKKIEFGKLSLSETGAEQVENNVAKSSFGSGDMAHLATATTLGGDIVDAVLCEGYSEAGGSWQADAAAENLLNPAESNEFVTADGLAAISSSDEPVFTTGTAAPAATATSSLDLAPQQDNSYEGTTATGSSSASTNTSVSAPAVGAGAGAGSFGGASGYVATSRSAARPVVMKTAGLSLDSSVVGGEINQVLVNELELTTNAQEAVKYRNVAMASASPLKFSGTILTWDNVMSGKSGDLAYGNYKETIYDPEENSFSYTATTYAGWTNPNQGLIASNSGTRNTLRFAASDYGQTIKGPVYTFTPLTLAGIIVDKGATGYSITSSGTAERTIYLGNPDGTAAYSLVCENFSINKSTGSGKVYLRGTQTIDVALDKTYTITSNNGVEISGSLTLQGGGTLALQGNGDLVSQESAIISLDNSNLGFRADGGSRTYGLAALTVKGTSRVSIYESGTQGYGWNATVNINALRSVDSSAVVSLGNAARANGSVFNIKGGAFSGEIVMLGEATTKGTKNRMTAVQLQDADVASESVLCFDVVAGKAQYNSIGLGIGTDVTLLGIRNNAQVESTIYSGSLNAGYTTFSSTSDERHSITITGSGDYVTSATLLNKLDLVMNGQGSQKFTGNMGSFDGSITVRNGTLDISGDLGTGVSAVTVTGGTLLLSGRNTFTSDITVEGGTLKLGSSSALGKNNGGSGASTRTIAIGTDGVIDINGTDNTSYAYVLAGGKLVNNGSATTPDHIQTTKLSLTADSAVGGTGTFYLLTNDWGDTAIEMNGKKLTKEGTNTLYLWSTAVTGGGTLKIGDGVVDIGRHDDSKTLSSLQTDIELAKGGSAVLKGTFSLAGGYAIRSSVADARSESDVALLGAVTLDAGSGCSLSSAGVLSGAGSVVKTGDGTVVLSADNSYNGGTTVSAGTLVAGNSTALGSGAVTLTGGTLDLSANSAYTTGAITMSSGTLKLAGKSMLTSTGSISLTGGTLDLSRLTLTEGAEQYTLATGSSVTLADSMAKSFTLGSGASTDGYTLAVVDNNTLVLNYAATPTDLYWKGDASGNGTWNTVADNMVWTNEAGTQALAFPATGTPNVHFVDVGTEFDYEKEAWVFAEVNLSSAVKVKDMELSVSSLYEERGTHVYLKGEGSLTADCISVASSSVLKTAVDVTADKVVIDEFSQWTYETSSERTFKGKLFGSGVFTKDGAGRLLLENSSEDFGGHVDVKGGTLVAGSASALGTGTVSVGGVDLETFCPLDATLELGAGLDVTTGSLTMYGGSTLLFDAGSSLTLSGDFDFGYDVDADNNVTFSFGEGFVTSSSTSPITLVTFGEGASFTESCLSYISLDGLADSLGAALDLQGSSIVLTFTPPESESLIWRAQSGTWGSHNAWETAEGTPVTFKTGDDVEVDAPFEAVSITMHAAAEAGDMVVKHHDTVEGTTTVTIGATDEEYTLKVKNLELKEGTRLVTEAKVEAETAVKMGAGTQWTLKTEDDTTLLADISGEHDTVITKQNAGTLLLGGDNSYYIGSIVVEQGTLVAAGTTALGASRVTVKGGATLTLNPNAASGISLLGLSSTMMAGNDLTLEDNSTISFVGDTALGLYGTLTLGQGVTFDLSSYGFGNDTQVTLISSGAIEGGANLESAIILKPGTVLNPRLSLAENGTDVILTFDWAEQRVLYWQGGLGDWSTSQDVTTWHPSAATGDKTYFNPGDSVVFDTRTSTSSVSVLDESISAGTMTVQDGTHVVLQSRDGNATISVLADSIVVDGSITSHVYLDARDSIILGDKGVLNVATDVADRTLGAAVSGAGTLAKSEDGTLTLSGDNSAFTGTLDIRQGTVVAGSANALGNGSTINMADGTTLDGTANISGKTTISTKDDATAIVSAVLAVNGEDKLTFGGNGKITVSGSISGTGEVDKVGFGTTVLKNMESFTGTLHASQGTLQLESTLGDWDSGRGIAKFETESGSTIVLQGEKAITASELNWVAGTTFDLSKLNFTGERINLVELKPEDGKELRETFIVPYSQVTNWVGGAENTDRYTIQGMVLTGLNSYQGVKPVRLRFSAQSTVLYVYVEESSLDAKYWQGTSGDTWNNKTSNQWSGSEAGPGDSAWAFNAQNPNSAYFMDKGGDKTQVVKVQGLELSRESGGGIGWDHIGDMVFGKDAKYSLVRSEATQSGTTLVFESNSVIHTPVTMLVRSGAVVDIGLGLNMGNGSELQVESGATLTVKPRSQVKDESGETSLVSRGEKLNLFSVANQGTTTLDAGEVYAKFLTNYATMTIVSHDEYSAYSANESTATRLGTVTNMNGAALTFSGNCIYGFDIVTEDSTEPGYVLNYGDVTYDTADTDRDALVVAVPNKGTGTIHTKGNKAVHFDSVGMTEEWHGGKYTAVMGVGTVSTHDLDMQAAETAFNQHLEVTGKAVLAAGKKAYIHSSSEIADLALKSIIGEDEDGEVVIQASSDLHYGGQAVVEYPIYAWDEETYEAFTEPVVEGYTQTTHSADEVTVEAGSTLYVDKGATVTLGSLNAAPTDAGIGHVTVGEGDELSSTLSASLEIEGVANVDTFTVVSGTATVQGAASINQIMQDGGTLTLEKNSVLNGSGSGAAKTGGTVTGGTLVLGDKVTLTQDAVIDVRGVQSEGDTLPGIYAVSGNATSKIDASNLKLVVDDTKMYYREVNYGETSINTNELSYRSGFVSSGDELVKLFDMEYRTTDTGEKETDHYLVSGSEAVYHSQASGMMTLIGNDNVEDLKAELQKTLKENVSPAYDLDEYIGWAYLHAASLGLETYYVRDIYTQASEAAPKDRVTLSQIIEASRGEGDDKTENPNLQKVVFDVTQYNKTMGDGYHNGTLTVDTDTSVDLFAVTKDTVASINITGLTTVTANGNSAGVQGTLHLEGTGVYEITNRDDLGTGISLRGEVEGQPEWDGTVRVTGTSANLSIEELSVGSGEDASTIEFKYWDGALEGGVHSTDAYVVLTGTAVKFVDDKVEPAAMTLTGTQDIDYTFTNDVTGETARVRHNAAEDGTAGGVAMHFTGDTQGWDGIYEQNAATWDVLTFTGGSKVNAGVVVSQGDMELTYGGTVTTVNSDVTVYKGGEGATNALVSYTGGKMTVSGLLYSDGRSGLTLNVGPADGETDTVATFTGEFVGTEKSLMLVNKDSTAKIETDAELLRVYGSAGSNVTVGTGKTLKLSSTDAENSYSEFHQLTNAGTIDMKADGGSIHLVVDEDVQNPSYRVGALELTDAAGEAAIETATNGKTVQVDITSLSGPKDAGQVLALENQDGTGTVNYNLGGDTHFTGTIQFGADSAVSKDATGVTNVVLKSDDVAANAVLKSTGTQAGTANVVVDTANASVKGITSDDNPAGTVYGTDGSANKKLTITGDGEYSYKGDLGAKLDIAYTGDGKQTFEGGAAGFSGKVTVDNNSTDAGVLEVLNATSMDITDLTIGSNNTLAVKNAQGGDSNVTVSGTLLAKGGSTTSGEGNASRMDASLTLADKSVLDVSAARGIGGLDLGGTLTIASGALLSSGDMATVWNMEVGDKYDLAFNVTGLTVGSGVDWNEEVGGWDAAQVFGNGMKEGEFYIRHVDNGGNGKNVGQVFLYRLQTPEPTTGTLSLLALAALCARRRRKA